MLSARPPILTAFFSRRLRCSARRVRLLRSLPQPPAREPLHHYIFVRAPELLKRRQQLLLLARAERRRLAPDLVVEILSPGTRKTDEVKKRQLYERFGVSEYWVVDPEVDMIKVYRRVEDAFVRVAELSVEQRDVLTTPLLPDWSVALSAIFASLM